MCSPLMVYILHNKVWNSVIVNKLCWFPYGNIRVKGPRGPKKLLKNLLYLCGCRCVDPRLTLKPLDRFWFALSQIVYFRLKQMYETYLEIFQKSTNILAKIMYSSQKV